MWRSGTVVVLPSAIGGNRAADHVVYVQAAVCVEAPETKVVSRLDNFAPAGRRRSGQQSDGLSESGVKPRDIHWLW